MMEATVRVTYKLSSACTEKVKQIYKDNEGKYYLQINLYAISEVSQEADKMSIKAKANLDTSMKGWSPVNEIGWQIYNAMGVIKREDQDDLLEVTYDRRYTK